MGMDTGAYKDYQIGENNEVHFLSYYGDVEGENLKFPNGEFVELADCLNEMSDGQIDISKYLIWDYTDYENPNYTHAFNQISEFSFEAALAEGKKAKTFISTHTEEVNKQYTYIFNAGIVLDYLLNLWQKGYYIAYDY